MKKHISLISLAAILISMAMLVISISCGILGGSSDSGYIFGGGGSGGGGGGGGGNQPGLRVANDFGTNLSRDIDGDGDNDSAVILNQIGGGPVGSIDYGISITLDNSEEYIYVVGRCENGGNYDAFIVKLDRYGNLVNSFGSSGKLVLDNIAGGHRDDFANSVKFYNNGDIYVCGSSEGNATGFDMFVLKLDSDGNLYNNFGNNGKVILNSIAGVNKDDGAIDMVLDNNGNIYVCGGSINNSNNLDAFVVKLDAGGNQVVTFGNGGKAIFSDLSGNNAFDEAYSIAIDNNGDIIVSGGSEITNVDIFVIKINSNGNLVNSFANGGIAVFHNVGGGNGNENCFDMKLDNNGNIYLTGYTDVSWNDRPLLVMKLDNNGNLVSNFGNGGKVLINNIASNSYNAAFGRSLAIDNNGNIYVAGHSWRSGNDSDIFVIKMDGVTGQEIGRIVVRDIVQNVMDNADWLFGMALNNLGQIFVTGNSDNTSYGKPVYVIKIE